MIRRTFLSAVLASVTGVLGFKAQANRDWSKYNLRVEIPLDNGMAIHKPLPLNEWLAAPSSEGRWIWKPEDGFMQIVSVKKSNGRLYAAWYDRMRQMTDISLASEMGGEWRRYED